jgi:dTDP-4-amino-4,6-dideoxygalactose transaminase
MNVPFLNLAAQFASLKDELLPAVEKVLSSGHYVLGPNVAALEGEIAAFVGTRFAVGVNSGSDSLTLGLRALKINPGEEVITTPFTYIAPAEAIHQIGGKIVFADIDAKSFNIDPGDVARKITSRTKAVIAVHLFGQPAPMKELLAITQPLGIQIVEDCAQAIGAIHDRCCVGSLGRVGCFSFYPTKNLGRRR